MKAAVPVRATAVPTKQTAAVKPTTKPAPVVEDNFEDDFDAAGGGGGGGGGDGGGGDDFDNLLGDLADQMAGIDDMLDF